MKQKKNKYTWCAAFCVAVAHCSEVQKFVFFFYNFSLWGKSVFLKVSVRDIHRQTRTMGHNVVRLWRYEEEMSEVTSAPSVSFHQWVGKRPVENTRNFLRRTFTLSAAVKAVLLASFLLADTDIFVAVKCRQWAWLGLSAERQRFWTALDLI